MPTFRDRLVQAQRTTRSALCVGLDPDLERIPEHLTRSRTPEAAVEHFCRAIVEATAPVASAYKLNFAFFERLGDRGFAVLRRVLESIPNGRITIADAKRGDIGNSARFYAGSALHDLGFDSITVSPYMGQDSVMPFIQDAAHAAFILVRTSNPGRTDLQDLLVEGTPLYARVAETAMQWDAEAAGSIGFVVGASDLQAMARIRALGPGVPFLIPGVGAQGGDPAEVLACSGHAPGLSVVNSSRGICYASPGSDFAEAAARAARTAADALPVSPETVHG
ncbi:MAG: orotidine-5'-phosphate decarboxylase [Rhodothermales bacterium]|nr:orotidine-5'-phosphate decarboxylase [Rhodothermales bacterium]